MSLEQFLLILLARKRAALGVVGLCILAAAALSLVMPKQYTAFASLVVDVKPDPVAPEAYPGQLSDYMQSQADIIASERVARRVVTTLGLDQDPELRHQWEKDTGRRGDFNAWLAGGLLKRIAVLPAREGNVLTISAKWTDAAEAAAVANGFVQAYIDTNIELRVQPAQQYAKWFEGRSAALRTDLEAKQKLLSDYEADTGIIGTDERLDIESTRLAELSSQLVAIQAQRQESQARQQEARGGNDTVPEILQSQLIAGLKADLSLAEAKEKDISTQFGTNHPDYQRTEAQINSLKQQISIEQRKVVTSLHNATQVNMLRERDIHDALDAQKQRVLELKHEHDKAASLSNDVVTAQRNLDAVTLRLAQSSLEGQTSQGNIIPLAAATEPAKPSSPQYLLNFVAAIALGTALGIATALVLEKIDPRIRRDLEITSMLGVPLLVRIVRIPSLTKRRNALASARSRLTFSSS
jgi:chain length determinant protein EpsF